MQRRVQENNRTKKISTGLLFLVVVLVTGVARTQAGTDATYSPKPAARRRIIVSISDRKLALVEDGQVVKMYRVAVGAPGSPSPRGEFTVVHRIPHPTWYASGKVVPPGPENPLGTRWIGLSRQGYGIHGTNAPHSIGRRASHGCIRMHNHEVEELFELVRAGDVVELHGKRTPELAQIFATPEQPAQKAAPRPTPGPSAPAVLATAVAH